MEEAGVFPTSGQSKSGLRKGDSKHHWLGYFNPNLKAGSHRVEVKAKDPYGLEAYEVSYFTLGRFDE